MRPKYCPGFLFPPLLLFLDRRVKPMLSQVCATKAARERRRCSAWNASLGTLLKLTTPEATGAVNPHNIGLLSTLAARCRRSAVSFDQPGATLAFVVQASRSLIISRHQPVNRNVGELPQSQASNLRVCEHGEIVHLHQETFGTGLHPEDWMAPIVAI